MSLSIRFVHIDLYDVCCKVYFSETTFYPAFVVMYNDIKLY